MDNEQVGNPQVGNPKVLLAVAGVVCFVLSAIAIFIATSCSPDSGSGKVTATSTVPSSAPASAPKSP